MGWHSEVRFARMHHRLIFVGDLLPKYGNLHNNNNNRFAAICLGLPVWAGVRRNIHPPTILIITHTSSASSIYYHP